MAAMPFPPQAHYYAGEKKPMLRARRDWTQIGNGVLPFTCCRASGSSSAVERQLPKLDVAGSIPVSRSINSSICTGAIPRRR